MKRKIAILGSTGSIGTQALDVISNNPDLFQVEVLTANNRVDLLIDQAKKYEPNAVVIANTSKYQLVKDALSHLDIKVYAGNDAIAQIVEMDSIDMVLTAMVGYSGLEPTVNAIKAKKAIALANKETLVVAGELVMGLANEYRTPIIPVDSEHSAVFQCLVGEPSPVDKVILTASGGPFRGYNKTQLEGVTRADALNHPNWCMGAKITIDSATLMNKGFEVIEAGWLFGLSPEQIEVVVHPQSIIHSMVQFEDGSVKAQLGLPDMRLPIQYAFSFPHRIKNDFQKFSFANYPNLTFEQPNTELFPCLSLAWEAMAAGGNTPCVLNAANEVVVDAFLNDRIRFVQIPQIIEQTIGRVSYQAKPSLSDYKETDAEARAIALEYVNNATL
ncbi:MAG TPA: 1-deoxy-D-xylulose-5-phosphate reductoisomerase [Tenuifilaceae bacterium]|nr:1-deoxy-D-xylulose-5-phosphate reductoisomerase [Tenuifilaceae bacterium]HPX04293.1 1-deoxy-D-xylulose-5-phosphate reductoisomerase [Tenuifilaceae bacterium]